MPVMIRAITLSLSCVSRRQCRAKSLFWAIRVRGVQVFALIALLAGPAAGQRISGLITNQQGNPVVGVLLRWTNPQGQTTTVFSDAVGLYQVDLGVITLVEADTPCPAASRWSQTILIPSIPERPFPSSSALFRA